MNSRELLRSLFPRVAGQKNFAITGLIPIEAFDAMEGYLRPHMRAAGLRAMYRGPRVNNNTRARPSTTRRCDATGVLLYLENR